jgi:hypothetical protein
MTSTLINKPITRAVKFKDDPEWLSILPLIDNSSVQLAQLLQLVHTKFPTADVLQRQKQYASAQKKRKRKEVPYQSINDLIKGTVLTDTIQQAMAVVIFLLRHCDVVKWEAKTGDNMNPYCGALHVDIRFGGLTCEIQVMPRSTWVVKKQSNKFYKTGKANEASHLWNDVPNFSQQQLKLMGVH